MIKYHHNEKHLAWLWVHFPILPRPRLGSAALACLLATSTNNFSLRWPRRMSRLFENDVLMKPFPPPSPASLLSLTERTVFKLDKDSGREKCYYQLLKSPGDLLNRLGLFCESKMKSFDEFGEILTRRNSGFSTSYQESDSSGAILSILTWTSFLTMFSMSVWMAKVSFIMTRSRRVVQYTLIPALHCIG